MADQASSGGKDQAKEKSYPGLDPASDSDPFPATYHALPSSTVALVGATIFTGTGQRIENGTLILDNGKITAVGANLPMTSRAQALARRYGALDPAQPPAYRH